MVASLKMASAIQTSITVLLILGRFTLPLNLCTLRPLLEIECSALVTLQAVTAAVLLLEPVGLLWM